MYKEASDFYNSLTADIDYGEYADYYERIFRKFAKEHPKSVVDLGCGTGSLTVKMAEKGYDMTGVDASTQMLSVAALEKEQEILWINQQFTELDLFGTYNAGISLLDCVNHLISDTDVERYFNRLKYFIEPGGLFIFDINTEYKFRNIYKNDVFYSLNDELSYIWQNNYDADSGICTMDITFFQKEDCVYRRFDTMNIERAYSTEFLTQLLLKSGFKVEKLYDDCTFNEPSLESKRIFFVCRRQEDE